MLNSASFNVANVSQPIDFVLNAGERVGLQYSRSNAFEGSGAALLTLNISGYLEALPYRRWSTRKKAGVPEDAGQSMPRTNVRR